MTSRTLGRYQLLERLGRGGMGEVWRARDPALRRDVAVKVLRRDGDDGKETLRDDFVQRFLREARAAASLKHPNVVAIHDVGVDEEPYIVMEWVEGAPLRGFIGDASVPVARRIEWLVEIARALAAAHEMGLVHRDVKPDNVMITKDGHAKVLDFGIAKAVGTLDEDAAVSQRDAPESFRTQQGRIVGTPKYMAPEQLRGDPIDARVDQWAWACVAYELLTGSMPDRDEIPQPISLTMPEVPFDVAAAFVRARSFDPDKRFDSMRALLAAFAVAPSGEAIVSASTARRDPDAPTTTGPVRRSRWRVALVALASFAAAGLAVAAWRHRAPAIVARAPVAPTCSFTMLPDTPLGASPAHFFSVAHAIAGGVLLATVRADDGTNAEQLVTVTQDAVTSRAPALLPMVSGRPTALFVVETPADVRHYLVYSGDEVGPLVVGRTVSNDTLVDATRVLTEDFHPSEVTGFFSSHTKPPVLAIIALGNDVGLHSPMRSSIRLFGKGLSGHVIHRMTTSDDPRNLAIQTSGHHIAYTFSAGDTLYLGSFAIEGRVEERNTRFDTPMRVDVALVTDAHDAVGVGDASSRPGRAFEGETLHLAWFELGTRRLRHTTLRTDAPDAAPIADEPIDVPTDGSTPDLRIDGGTFSLAWHDGAHVYYGEGASLLGAAKRYGALPDATVSAGPWIASGTSRFVVWISGANNAVRRAIVSCR